MLTFHAASPSLKGSLSPLPQGVMGKKLHRHLPLCLTVPSSLGRSNVLKGVSLFWVRAWDPIRELVRCVADLHFTPNIVLKGVSLLLVWVWDPIRELVWGFHDLYFSPQFVLKGVCLFLVRLWDPIRDLALAFSRGLRIWVGVWDPVTELSRGMGDL